MTLARRIEHSVRSTALGAVLLLAAASRSPLSAQMVERFDADPLTGQSRNAFIGEGDVASRFTFLADEPSHFPGDHDGTLREETRPTATPRERDSWILWEGFPSVVPVVPKKSPNSLPSWCPTELRILPAVSTSSTGEPFERFDAFKTLFLERDESNDH